MGGNAIGWDTNGDVRDYATRVDNYIRSLHEIVSNARRDLTTPDAFPWPKWAAFRAQWDQWFDEEIRYAYLTMFSRDTVTNYFDTARKWETIIARHYHLTPEEPRPEKLGAASSAYIGVLLVGGVTLWALSRKK